MEGLTAFQRDLLYVIASFDIPSGQTLSSELGEYYDSKINHGRLYPNLDGLVDKGLLEKGKINHRANSYTLTEAGEQALRDRRKWENQYVDL